MNIPLLDVNAQNLPLEAELLETFARVLRSGRFILGEEVEAFERECAALVGAKHALSVSSGTDALLLALMALEIGPGDEVLCPAFTFFATAGSIARVGAVPVFCDVCPVCFNLDVNSLSERITERTKAIMPVHLFGQSADMGPLRELASRHGLVVIEDCAQSIGSRHKGESCGLMGNVGCCSFFPSKNLGGFGDGGLVVTNDDALAELMAQLRNHGMHPRYVHHRIGGNFRLDALQCALMRVKLPHYASYVAGRQRNASFYLSTLANHPLVQEACTADCCCVERQFERLHAAGTRLLLPHAYEYNEMIWNQFTVRVLGEGERERFRSWLTQHGVANEVYYPIPLHRQKCFAHLPAHALLDCPVADQLAAQVVSLPIYPELTPEQLQHVAATILHYLDT